jgi:hypothetical protein
MGKHRPNNPHLPHIEYFDEKKGCFQRRMNPTWIQTEWANTKAEVLGNLAGALFWISVFAIGWLGYKICQFIGGLIGG